jgi:hypothetical protein
MGTYLYRSVLTSYWLQYIQVRKLVSIILSLDPQVALVDDSVKGMYGLTLPGATCKERLEIISFEIIIVNFRKYI